MLNMLCSLIPAEERVISVEATRELRIRRRRLLALEAGQAGRGGVNLAELVEQR